MKKLIVPTIALALVTMLGVHQASAATTTTAQVIAKSDTAITTRITSLNKAVAHIAKYKNLTDAQKASLTSTVQTTIDAMNTLKAKIDADTDLATVKADYASITKAYRVYLVVLPNTATVAAVDNAMSNITAYQTTIATLNTRINTAQTAGKDVTVVQAASADATVKLTDGQSQANALITAVTSLKVDNGDATVKANNKTQLAAAKAAKKALLADVAAAKKDIASVRSGLKTLKA